MSFGVGFISDAVARQRYASAGQNRVGRVYVRRHGTDGGADTLQDSDWEEFDCFHLCVTCGYLAAADDQACPGCGSQGWSDLKHIASFEELRKMERRERRVIPPKYQAWGLYLGLAAGALTAVLSHLFGSVTLHHEDTYIPMPPEVLRVPLPVSIGLGLVVALVGTFVLRRLIAFIALRRRPQRPQRWHMPLPLPGPGAPVSQELHGVPEPQQDLLKAPLSGRECLGYEITVLFDDPTDKRPPMWVLEEERSVHFILDGQHVEPDGVTIDLPTEQVAREESGFGDEQVGKFLRKRGLSATEGEYRLFEALVLPRERYSLELFEGAEPAVPRIRR